jgi:hypothetical protein
MKHPKSPHQTREGGGGAQFFGPKIKNWRTEIYVLTAKRKSLNAEYYANNLQKL